MKKCAFKLLLTLMAIVICVTPAAAMSISSSSFKDNGGLPVKYVYNDSGMYPAGKNISPQLAWDGVPSGTKRFVLIMRDVSEVNGGMVHWALSLPLGVTALDEDVDLSKIADASFAGVADYNKTATYAKNGYCGPFPPKEDPAHKYTFTIYALASYAVDIKDLEDGANTEGVISALDSSSLASGSITCYYPAKSGSGGTTPDGGGTTPGAAEEPSLALVIDDTGSMSEEIEAVKDSLKKSIEEIRAKDLIFPWTAVYTFKDDVTLRITTNDPDKIIAEVNTFTASGGGDTPEASNAALIEAGKKLIDYKSDRKAKVFFATDATSRPEGPTSYDVAEIYNSKGIEFHGVWTGPLADSGTKTLSPSGGDRSTSLKSGPLGDVDGVVLFDSLAKAVKGSSFTKVKMETEEGRTKFREILTGLVTKAATEETEEKKPGGSGSDGSSGGCNAGISSLALLLAAAAIFMKKSSRK
ncbi:MAG: YbhB/YbcL family Raf kinase inhibitor-like protein [Synergistes jonesii]|uniref:YbhB/YbcL family Raf kinase inhibitor-like protein n=1 Tax=Synergistes jonesii TaxID=2754 RepID=UPI002A75CAB1|nr:YbhB/YbcL family Raf kinase inhibitor-like protein [Synergistes jonesii]MDY2984957.1 YbhB/YbcL family Raf kinase inhibitor-like protein [Synergistes jonesii]